MATVIDTLLDTSDDTGISLPRISEASFVFAGDRVETRGATTIRYGDYAVAQGDGTNDPTFTIHVKYDPKGNGGLGLTEAGLRLRYKEEITVGSEEPYYEDASAYVAVSVPSSTFRDEAGVLDALAAAFNAFVGAYNTGALTTTRIAKLGKGRVDIT
jgi:hypothetical protein